MFLTALSLKTAENQLCNDAMGDKAVQRVKKITNQYVFNTVTYNDYAFFSLGFC
jgi:hypothetical protein